MKKLTSLFLIVCLCFSAITLLASCEHKHELEEKWSYDNTHHWHACKDESCTHAEDYAAHEWVQQEFFAENGDLVFDCVVCGARKTEPAPLTEDAWKAAFRATMTAENVTWTHQQNNDAVKTNRIDGNKAYVTNSHPYNGTKDCYYLAESAETIWHYTAEQEGIWTREQVTSTGHITFLESILDPFSKQYSAFDLNRETGAYEAARMEMLGYTFVNVEVRIENGYLTYFTYTLQMNASQDIDQNYTITLVFSNYGTTSVTIPSIGQ